jgi:hypothetical protein
MSPGSKCNEARAHLKELGTYGFFGKSSATVTSVALLTSRHDFALNVNSATAHVGMCVISDER